MLIRCNPRDIPLSLREILKKAGMFKGFDFDSWIDDLAGKRVMIIGDVMVDTYLWGKVNRVSPEAPVPIVSDIIEENRLGGAANVALNIKSMGAVPILCSVIGGDERGQLFLELLEDQNLGDVGITVDDYRITTQKTRVISGFKHLLRVDEEIENNLSKNSQEQFMEIIFSLIESGRIDSIIFQDYDKGVVTPSMINKIMRVSSAKGIPVLADPKFRNFSRFKGLTLFKPNYKELVKGLDIDVGKDDIELIAEKGEAFRKEKGHEILLITLSDRGILVVYEGGKEYFPAIPRDVTDVSGAGDTVISIAALCYASKMSPGQLAGLSNLAGGQVCEKAGVVPVSREQLREDCLSFLC